MICCLALPFGGWLKRGAVKRVHAPDTRMKQSAPCFQLYQKKRHRYGINMFHSSSYVCFVFCFGCQLSIQSCVHVKPENPTEFRLNVAFCISRKFHKPDRIWPPKQSGLSRHTYISVLSKPLCVTLMIFTVILHETFLGIKANQQDLIQFWRTVKSSTVRQVSWKQLLMGRSIQELQYRPIQKISKTNVFMEEQRCWTTDMPCLVQSSTVVVVHTPWLCTDITELAQSSTEHVVYTLCLSTDPPPECKALRASPELFCFHC